MKSRMVGAVCGAALVFGAGAVLAQESSNRVDVKTDWSVFAEDNPKECWGVSSPKETVNTRDGKPVSARRGDILLSGQEFGRVRTMFNESGGEVGEAGPSIPVEVLGLSAMPNAGDEAVVVPAKAAPSAAQARARALAGSGESYA